MSDRGELLIRLMIEGSDLGLHITDQQMRLYMSCRQTHDAAVAAAKAGFSTATGYRIENDPPRSNFGAQRSVAIDPNET